MRIFDREISGTSKETALFLKRNEFSNKGFTLIEILVVFSVITILSAVGIASFASYSRTQQVAQSANSVKLLISQARFNAISTVKSNSNEQGITIDCGVDALSGYSITTFGDSSIDLNQVCASGGSNRIKRYTLPSGLTFTAGTTCNQVLFDSLSAKGNGLPCNFVVNGFGQSKTISVDAIGNVSIN
ncbi:MAG: prepilin-type N-terminal cleavage/methylation domain-containing protein [Candidatus Levybacteria bacterium]|nr:prepilin-type N-terminal cleavage/methylation domain-containing protein [Candidatus Levybacteria bacterium]